MGTEIYQVGQAIFTVQHVDGKYNVSFDRDEDSDIINKPFSSREKALDYILNGYKCSVVNSFVVPSSVLAVVN